jgi:hypothetical protein
MEKVHQVIASARSEFDAAKQQSRSFDQDELLALQKSMEKLAIEMDQWRPL